MEENNEQNVEVANSNPSAISKPKNELQTVPVNSNTNFITNIDLLDESQVAKAEVFLKRIMRSDKGGIKSIEDGIAMIMRAKDLNVPFSTALEHVHVINGRTGVDIHVIKALLRKAGVTWDEPIKDYAPLYEYTDGFNVYIDGSFPEYAVRCANAAEAKEKAEKNTEDKIFLYPVRFYQDFSGNIYKDYQLNANYVIVNNKQQVAKVTAEGKIPIVRIPNKPVDYVTQYRLYRTVNGERQSSLGSFSYSEANAAGMFEKDTYRKYARILIGHRAFTYAARDIASDVILGAYETTELQIINNLEPDIQDCIDVTPSE